MLLALPGVLAFDANGKSTCKSQQGRARRPAPPSPRTIAQPRAGGNGPFVRQLRIPPGVVFACLRGRPVSPAANPRQWSGVTQEKMVLRSENGRTLQDETPSNAFFSRETSLI